jgi:tRNA-specific 2-thiouridylase
VDGEVLVQCSAHGKTNAASISVAGDDVRVRWHSPQRRVAPGQSVVFYDASDTVVLGGGIAR